MDPASLAITVAILIAKRAVEAAAGEAGKGMWASIAKLHDTLRVKFRGDSDVEETMERLEAKPTSEARASELAEVLQSRFQADPGLAAELLRLVEEAQANPTAASFVTTVRDNAQVGKIVNVQSAGDMHF
jgi:hypothetical protein